MIMSPRLDRSQSRVSSSMSSALREQLFLVPFAHHSHPQTRRTADICSDRRRSSCQPWTSSNAGSVDLVGLQSACQSAEASSPSQALFPSTDPFLPHSAVVGPTRSTTILGRQRCMTCGRARQLSAAGLSTDDRRGGRKVRCAQSPPLPLLSFASSPPSTARFLQTL